MIALSHATYGIGAWLRKTYWR